MHISSNNNHRQFLSRWRECYKATKGIDYPTESKIQKQIISIGPYLMIKNYQYRKKRVTDSVDKVLEMNSISLPFSQATFNFNKIKETQILYSVEPKECQLQTAFHQKNADHFVIISGSPIIQGHSIFVPYLKENHPQIISRKLLEITIEFASKLSYLKFGYNSQGGASSVNHFHVQMMDLCHLLPNNKFRFEQIKGTILFEREYQIKISTFVMHYACFIKIQSPTSLHKEKSAVILNTMKIIDFLIAQTIPHNLIITDPCSMFLVLRGFAFSKYKYGWLQYCGIFVAKTEEQLSADIWTIDAGFKMLQIQSYSNILQNIKNNLNSSEGHFH